MQFNSLIKTSNWLSVKATLLAIYPEQIESIIAYENVYNKLKLMELEEVAIDIILTQHHDDETFDPSCVEVSGINLNPNKDDISIGLAIEFTAWKKWLGMGIDKQTLKEFTELEIIAHCLYEMTFAGYDENEIQADFKNIKGIKDDYLRMTNDEKQTNTISLNELKKRLDIKDDKEL